MTPCCRRHPGHPCLGSWRCGPRLQLPLEPALGRGWEKSSPSMLCRGSLLSHPSPQCSENGHLSL